MRVIDLFIYFFNTSLILFKTSWRIHSISKESKYTAIFLLLNTETRCIHLRFCHWHLYMCYIFNFRVVDSIPTSFSVPGKVQQFQFRTSGIFFSRVFMIFTLYVTIFRQFTVAFQFFNYQSVQKILEKLGAVRKSCNHKSNMKRIYNKKLPYNCLRQSPTLRLKTYDLKKLRNSVENKLKLKANPTA